MKGSKEYKKWMNRIRKRFGGKNGVVKGALLDSPEMERKMAKNKRVVEKKYEGHKRRK